MNVIEALKIKDISIDYDDRYIYYNKETNKWVVMQAGYKKTGVLIETEDEDKAVEILLGEGNEY